MEIQFKIVLHVVGWLDADIPFPVGVQHAARRVGDELQQLLVLFHGQGRGGCEVREPLPQLPGRRGAAERCKAAVLQHIQRKLV